MLFITVKKNHIWHKHRNLLFIMLYMTLLADKENLSFICQEEPKHSAGHHCQ